MPHPHSPAPNGEMVYLWRAVDQEGEILESCVTRTRDKAAALTFMKKALKRHGSPEGITTALSEVMHHRLAIWLRRDQRAPSCLSALYLIPFWLKRSQLPPSRTMVSQWLSGMLPNKEFYEFRSWLVRIMP
jgi:hypothetical protein